MKKSYNLDGVILHSSFEKKIRGSKKVEIFGATAFALIGYFLLAVMLMK